MVVSSAPSPVLKRAAGRRGGLWFRAELGDVGGCECEAAGLGFGVLCEGFFEAELAFVLPDFCRLSMRRR